MPNRDANQLTFRIDEQVPLMHVGMKETVAQRLAEKLAHDQQGDSFGILSGCVQLRSAAQRRSLHPFRRQNARSRARPVDSRYAKLHIARGVFGELRRCGRFHPQIELKRDAGRQRIDKCPHAQPPRLGEKPLRPARGKSEGRQIAGEFGFDTGPENLHGHGARRLVICCRAVHLGDRGGGERLVEKFKCGSKRNAESGFYFLPRAPGRKWRKAVLQRGERGRGFVTDDIGPRRQHLAKLDIGGPQFLEREGKPHARRNVAVCAASAPREASAHELRRHASRKLAWDQCVVPRQNPRRI